MGKKETLTTLALPGEGKWDTSPRGRGRARKTDALLFTVYCRRGTAKRRQHYKTHRPLKGKLLTTFCASLALLHPLLSLTHWIFRSLMLPYKSSSHSAKCVRCASLPLKGQGQRVQRVQKVQRVQRGRIAAEGGNDFICRLTAASGKRIADSRPTSTPAH